MNTLNRTKLLATLVIATLLVMVTSVIVAADSRATANVNVQNLSFNPDPTIIRAGDTVQWDNQGGFHNVEADDGSFRCANGCDDTGGNGAPSSATWSGSVDFNTPGTYLYHCEIHGDIGGVGMSGQIIVLPNVFINEIRIDQAGSDLNEYAELFGPAATSLDGLTYLVIGESSQQNSGIIEAAIDLTGQSIPANGYFIMAESTFTLTTATFTDTLNFENGDNVTH
ncbi:MAG TPA: hypothetical protein ENJ56_08080, partial [Anaerolineae bacterium]|nr:hypothetical protein [Anaerolineae bacterium]